MRFQYKLKERAPKKKSKEDVWKKSGPVNLAVG